MQIFSHKLWKVFLAWRLWLFVPLLLATFFVPIRENSVFTTIWERTNPYAVVESPLIYPWSNFDGVHYLAIASNGYTTEGRFLPLFPLLVGIMLYPISLITEIKPYGSLVFWTSFILSNTFFFASLYYLKKLLEFDYSEKLVNRVIASLLVFPTSFFFVAIYTESLFLLLTVLVFLNLRQQKWYAASVFAMLLSITRLPGVLILIPVLYEFFRNEFSGSLQEFFKPKRIAPLLWFAMIPVPLLLYAYFNFVTWGDPLHFVNAHGSLGNGRAVSGIVFPLVTLYRYLQIFLTVSIHQYEFWVAVIEFFSLLIASTGLFLAWLHKVRPSYLLFAVAVLSLPLLSGTLTGFPRYVLLAFPVVIGFGLQFEVMKKELMAKYGWPIVLIGSLVAQAGLLMLFARSWYVA